MFSSIYIIIYLDKCKTFFSKKNAYFFFFHFMVKYFIFHTFFLRFQIFIPTFA